MAMDEMELLAIAAAAKKKQKETNLTADQFKEGARKAYAAGDVATARSLINRGMAAEARELEANKSRGAEFTEVELPDGTIAEFPAGMSHDEIKGVLRRQFGPGGAEQTSGRKGFGRVLWENFVGDDDPSTQNLGEKVGSFLNKAGESMTMGLIGDEASAAVESVIPGVNYADRRDHYRQQEERFETDHPVAALGADIGGSAVAPLGAFGMLGRGASLLKRGVVSGTATGTLSGLHGFMEGEGGVGPRSQRAMSAGALGAGIGAVIPVAGSGVQRLADGMVARKAIRRATKGAPTTEALRAQGNAAYDAVDAAGVQIRPEAFDATRKKLADALMDKGLDPLPGTGNTPQSARLLQNMGEMSAEMASEPTAALPFKQLDQLRRRAGVPAGNMSNKVESSLGTEAISQLDDFVENLAPTDVTTGDVEALKTMIPKAREIWSRMSKSQLVDDAIESSENYLSGSASGIRNQFKRILNNPKLRRGFSDAERKMLRRAANGTLPEQLLYLAAGGIGNILTMGGGMATGGLPGFLAGTAAAAGLRSGANRVASRNAELARAVIASGGLQQAPRANELTRTIAEQLMRQGTAVTLPSTAN